MTKTIFLPVQLGIWLGCLALFATFVTTDRLSQPLLIAAICLKLGIWFLSILFLADKHNRARVTRLLAAPRFDHAYRWMVEPVLDWLTARYFRPMPQGASVAQTIRASLTPQVYNAALLLAVAYPIFLPALIWIASGTAGQLGTITFFPAREFGAVWPERAALAASFLILTAGFTAPIMAAAKRQPLGHVVAARLKLGAVVVAIAIASASAVAVAVLLAFAYAGEIEVAGAFAFAFAFAFAVASAMITLLAGAGAVAGAFATAVAFAVSSSVAFAVAVVVATAVAVAIERLWRLGKLWLALFLPTLLLPLSWIALALFNDWGVTERFGDASSIFLFLGVFPLINGIFDAISYAATFALLRLGLSRFNPILMSFFDTAIALILFLLLGAALIIVIATLNQLAGVTLLDIGAQLARVRTDFWGNLWVPMMLFSTAVPTALHFIVALLGAQVFVPNRLRRGAIALIGRIDKDAPSAMFAPLLTSIIFTVPFVIVLLIGAALWAWLGTVVKLYLGYYLDWLLMLSEGIGAI